MRQGRVDEVLVGAHALDVGGAGPRRRPRSRRRARRRPARVRRSRLAAGRGSRSAWPAAPGHPAGSRRTTHAGGRPPARALPSLGDSRHRKHTPVRWAGIMSVTPVSGVRWPCLRRRPRVAYVDDTPAARSRAAPPRSASVTASASVSTTTASRPFAPDGDRHRDADTDRGDPQRRQVDGGRGIGAAVGVADRGALGRPGARAGRPGQRDELRVLGGRRSGQSSSSSTGRRRWPGLADAG